MFVYDIADTEPLSDRARPLPKRITDPFAVTWRGDVQQVMSRTVEKAPGDGIRVTSAPWGASQAGCAMAAHTQGTIGLVAHRRLNPVTVAVEMQFDVVVNSYLDAPAQCATLLHELAHIYCGHLGTPTNSGGRRGPNSPGKKRSRPNQPPTSSPAATTPPFSSPPTFTNTWNRTGRSRPPRRSPPDIGTVKSAAPFRRVRSSKR
jgi:hypothetical protein